LECDNFSYVSIYYPICATRFTHIESSGNLEFLLSKTNVSAKIQELKSFIKKNNLSLTVHAPTWAVELASPNESIRKASVEAIINIFDLIKSLNSEALVLHLAGDFGSSVKKSEIFMRGYTRCL
jgi:sugar phosphate isomerase/epimerase